MVHTFHFRPKTYRQRPVSSKPFWKEGASILLVSFRSRFPEVWNKSCEKCFLCFCWYKKQKKNHEKSRGKILT